MPKNIQTVKDSDKAGRTNDWFPKVVSRRNSEGITLGNRIPLDEDSDEVARGALVLWRTGVLS